MNRQKVNYPETPDSWNELPQEFLDYLNDLDEARQIKLGQQVIDPLYPTYDYDWELDEEIPLRTVIEYWNSDKELPEHSVVIDEANDCLAEAAYDYYVESWYSY